MDYGTKPVEEVGEILKSLTPTSIAVLLFVMDDRIDKQVDMAEELNCTSAPISLSLQSLSEMSRPLVDKNRTYQITRTGQEVVSRLDEMMLAVGIDLCEIDWSNDDDKTAVNTALRPLHNSRSMLPFYVLDSINERIDGKSQTIAFDTIVDDVQGRMSGSEGSVSRRQVKHAIDRFETEEAIEVNEGTVSVRQKGIEQARLYDHLVDFLAVDESTYRTSVTDPIDGEEVSIQIPSRVTIGELSDQIQRLEEQYGRNEVLELQWSLKTPATIPTD